MAKRMLLIFSFLVFLVTAVKLNSTGAQRDSEEIYDCESLTKIEEGLEEVSKAVQENKEALRKLDVILSNQEKIIAELGVIKIRTTR